MLTYAQLETVLAAHLRVESDKKRKKFAIRIKQLQRLHCPRGVNSRGKRVAYAAGHILEMAVVFELIQLGLPANRAVLLVQFWWDDVWRAFLLARHHSHPIVVGFLRGDFAGLLGGEESEGQRDGEPDAPSREVEDGITIIGIDPADSAGDMYKALTVLAQASACLINISDILSSLSNALEKIGIEGDSVWDAAETRRPELGEASRTSNRKKS